MSATIILATAIALILAVDVFLLPQQSRLLIGVLVMFCAAALAILLFPQPFENIAASLGVERPWALLAFALSVLVVRELLISRSRQFTNEQRLVTMVRNVAIEHVESGSSQRDAES